MSEVRTFFEMSEAVGRLGTIRWKASVRPTATEMVSSGMQIGKGVYLTSDGNRKDEEEINVEELKVAESASDGVEQCDRSELDQRVEGPVEA